MSTVFLICKVEYYLGGHSEENMLLVLSIPTITTTFIAASIDGLLWSGLMTNSLIYCFIYSPYPQRVEGGSALAVCVKVKN